MAALYAHRALVRRLGHGAAQRPHRAACRNPRRAHSFPVGARQFTPVPVSPTASSSAWTAASPSSITRPAGAHREAGAHGPGAAIDAGSRHPARRRLQADRRRLGVRDRLRHRSKAAPSPGSLARSTSRRARRTATADRALAKLKALAATFEDESKPYLSLVHPMWKTHYGDYDHLARVKEWSRAGGGEGEGAGE